ncbi:uncharacterized protein LOC129224367 [Uloborus diversus]|uniref:uncharacterized protein LOC129224367 n=1 Tax=Uloborus diversus TaxID=327109 RepID=UPI00240941D8|nr:uncharacterized protein LOC129224367 [Uloborus diversus]
MSQAMFVLMIFSYALLTTTSGIKEHASSNNVHDKYQAIRHRSPREIRKTEREGRLLYHAPEESQDQRKMLLFQNRPREPLHDMYRKGFSYLHVPDFHREPVEERAPRRNGGNQSIDDIISGIIHLLGGDVLVTRPDTGPQSVLFPSSPRPTRINDRGPAHFDTSRDKTTPASPVVDISPTSVIPADSELSSHRLMFPDDTDVSRILGLINDTLPKRNTSLPDSSVSPPFIGDESNITSGHLEIIEIVPSGASQRHRTSDSPKTKPTATQSTQIIPTEVLTELDKNGHTFIETVVTSGANDASSVRNRTKTIPGVVYVDIPEHSPSNRTDIPILLPSTNVVPSPANVSHGDSTPSGPITEWLPIPKPPERGPNFSSNYIPMSDEPVIITRPPDSFEITITRQMYSNETHSVAAVPTFTSIFTPPDVTSSTDISVSIVATQVDIIYGRPTISKGGLPGPPLPPTGRPHVFPVDIGEVRPSIRPNVYPRPRPPDIGPPGGGPPKFGNGLRPLPVPRPGGNGILRKPPPFRPPPQLPEIRIDTCVVGDDSTCDIQLKEHCRTERGVSSCLCRPGYGRVVDRGPCTPVVSMLLTLKVAKLGDKNIDPSHFVPGSPEYQRLNFEAGHAMSTVFTFSPLADAYRGSELNRVYLIANRMVINGTVHLAEAEVRGSLRHHVEHAVAQAISRRDSRLGTSQLFVNGPLSALVEVEDLNECGDSNLNDCSEFAVCDNLFGTFQCKCKPGYTDKFESDPKHAGRICSACSPDYCNGKGQCVVVKGRQECRCRGNYGGSRCQVDNEVIGVSVGVSVIAIIVIAITAACLYLWNRRWKRAHQKSEAAKHAAYRLQTMADHVRWASTTPLSSTYVPSESTLQLAPPPLTSSASQLYAISNIQSSRHQQRNHLYEDDANPYGRIIRTLQKHNSLNHSGGLHYDSLNSECASSDEIGFPSVPSNSFVYHGTFPDRSSLYR